MDRNWTQICECEQNTVYNQYENQCFDCGQFSLKNLITTCQCPNNQIFNKQLNICQQKCTQQQVMSFDNQTCIDCPQNTLPLNDQECDCSTVSQDHYYVKAYNQCQLCDENSNYSHVTYQCECYPFMTQIYVNISNQFQVQCQYDCQTEDIDTLKQLTQYGLCQCSQNQYYNQTLQLCQSCGENAIQASQNTTCQCIFYDFIWVNNQCQQCPSDSTPQLAQQTCFCQNQNINTTYNSINNTCDLDCSKNKQIYNKNTLLCENCVENSIYNETTKICDCQEINEKQYIFDIYTYSNKCVKCPFTIVDGKCQCQKDNQIFNIQTENCTDKCITELKEYLSILHNECVKCPGIIDNDDPYSCQCPQNEYFDEQNLKCVKCQKYAYYNYTEHQCQCEQYYIQSQQNKKCILDCQNNTIIYGNNKCYECINGYSHNNQCQCNKTRQFYSYKTQQCVTCQQNSIYDSTKQECVCLNEQNYFYDNKTQKCLFQCQENQIKFENNLTCVDCGENIQVKHNQCWCQQFYKYDSSQQQCIEQKDQLIILGVSISISLIITVLLILLINKCCKKKLKIQNMDDDQTFAEKYQDWKYNKKKNKLLKKQHQLQKQQQKEKDRRKTEQTNQIKKTKHKKHKKQSK